MARKLFLLAALISLVALARAAPGFAATYDLESDSGEWEWTETFAEVGGTHTVGAAGSSFRGRNTWGEDGLWQIGGDYSYNEDTLKWQVNAPLTNTEAATEETPDGYFYTFEYTYNDIVTPGEVKFIANIPGGPSITSYDIEITITATYLVYDYSRTFQEGTLVGTGTNSTTGLPFTITADIIEVFGDHTHYGYFENFQLTYDASAVPIPGAVWLFGTGLLGLFCLGRRRKH